ncbi:hypothetical protein BDR04DRAFT_1151113 [Suillus decipiens]|nr:hypothetical protein BDR04DRAFT_1151113 [Suillus decipiens]
MTQNHPVLFTCQICNIYSHKHHYCNCYFYCICGKFASGHFTNFCPSLNRHPLLRKKSGDCGYYAELSRLEAAYDQAGAYEEENCIVNVAKAEEWLAGVDLNAIWFKDSNYRDD